MSDSTLCPHHPVDILQVERDARHMRAAFFREMVAAFGRFVLRLAHSGRLQTVKS